MDDKGLLEDSDTSLEGETSSELGTSESISRDTFFDILSNSRRRTVLRYMDLRDEHAPFSTGELAEVVAAHENNMDISQITTAQRKRAYVGISQTHLPALDNYGVLEFDEDQNQIEFAEDEERYIFDGLVALLEDELYPENHEIGEEYFEEHLTKYEETYLSQLRQKLPF